jgi:hypothetical protein
VLHGIRGLKLKQEKAKSKMKNLIPKKIINDCHNNSKAVKGRQQEKKLL